MRLRLESFSENDTHKEYDKITRKKVLKIAATFMERQVDRFISIYDKKECLVMVRIPNGYMVVDGDNGNTIYVDELDAAINKAIDIVGSAK